MPKQKIPRKEKKKVKKEFNYIEHFEKNFINLYYIQKKSKQKCPTN